MTAFHHFFAGVGNFLAQKPATFWLPPQSSSYAHQVDWLFYFIAYVSLFFFVLIMSIMAYFVIRYREGNVSGPEKSPHHSLPLELTWTIIPIIIVVMIFWWGFKGFIDMHTPPDNAYEIQVSGKQWSWEFTYPNGAVSDELHVPHDRNILLVITSQDVVHSVYIPAFRMKMDAVPGRYLKAWFRPTVAGEYDLFCAEYCGKQHSAMTTKVVVHPVGEFEKWVQRAADFHAEMRPSEAGERVYKIRGCGQCHSVDGRANVGPTFQGIFGRETKMRDGSTIKVDENYIRESILEPNAKIVAGYDAVMPTFQGRLSEKDISALIAFMKKLSGIEFSDEIPTDTDNPGSGGDAAGTTN